MLLSGGSRVLLQSSQREKEEDRVPVRPRITPADTQLKGDPDLAGAGTVAPTLGSLCFTKYYVQITLRPGTASWDTDL